MEYYIVESGIGTRSILRQNETVDIESAMLKAGLSVADANVVENGLVRFGACLPTLLANGYVIEMPGIGVLRGSLSGDATNVSYKVRFSVNKELTALVTAHPSYVLRKIDRPVRFLSVYFTIFPTNGGVLPSHNEAVIVRGKPFTIRGKFTNPSDVVIEDDVGTSTLVTSILGGSTSKTLRLDAAATFASGNATLRSLAGDFDMDVNYSVYTPLWGNTQLFTSPIALLPYCNQEYSPTVLLGLNMQLSSTQAIIKLQKRVGGVVSNVSDQTTVYPGGLQSGITEYFGIDLKYGQTLVGKLRLHRSNFWDYWSRNSGLRTLWFKDGLQDG